MEIKRIDGKVYVEGLCYDIKNYLNGDCKYVVAGDTTSKQEPPVKDIDVWVPKKAWYSSKDWEYWYIPRPHAFKARIEAFNRTHWINIELSPEYKQAMYFDPMDSKSTISDAISARCYRFRKEFELEFSKMKIEAEMDFNITINPFEP